MQAPYLCWAMGRGVVCARPMAPALRPAAAVPQYGDAVVVVGDGEVGSPVAIHVRRDQPRRTGAGGEGLGGGEAALPVPQHDGRITGAPIGRGEVEPAVAVEVAHRHAHGVEADGVI